MQTPAVNVSLDHPVLVTGATGYVAGWIIRRLLAEGLTVHATVRDADNESKIAHLRELEAELPGSLRFFEADLLDEGSFAEAMAGCSVVFHTASPFIAVVKDTRKELIEPALKGTRNVLNTATETPGVRRVVLTSSVAAIFGDNRDLSNLDAEAFTEDHWNFSSTENHQAYSYSKTLAEKAAWEIAEKQLEWDLVVLNPGLVVGRSLGSNPTSESFSIVKQFADRTMQFGAPRWGVGIVHVEDVADAHVRAAFMPEAKGRYLINAVGTDFPRMMAPIKAKYGAFSYPFAHWAAPNWLLHSVGRFFSKAITAPIIKGNIGVPFVADNSKSIKELGVTYQPTDPALVEMFDQLVEIGRLPKPGWPI